MSFQSSIDDISIGLAVRGGSGYNFSNSDASNLRINLETSQEEYRELLARTLSQRSARVRTMKIFHLNIQEGVETHASMALNCYPAHSVEAPTIST